MSLAGGLDALLPPERRGQGCIIAVVPDGAFVTYGIGVSLTDMRIPAIARGRVSVSK